MEGTRVLLFRRRLPHDASTGAAQAALAVGPRPRSRLAFERQTPERHPPLLHEDSGEDEAGFLPLSTSSARV